MINWQKIAMYIVLGALVAGLITLFIQNKRLERKVKDKHQLYVLEKEKRIEDNEIAFDSIEKLNDEIERLIHINVIDIDNTNAGRNEKKQDYEKAVISADTLNQSQLQRKLSSIFER